MEENRVPTQNDKISSEKPRTFIKDKDKIKNFTPYKAAIYTDKLNNYQALLDLGIDQQLATDLVSGFPNAKYFWFNSFIKSLSEGNRKFSTCDEIYIDKSWTSSAFKQAFSKLKSNLGLSFDSDSPNIPNYRAKGVSLACTNGNLVSNFKNPGVYNFATGKVEDYPDLDSMYRAIYNDNKAYMKKRFNKDDNREHVEKHCSCEDNSGQLINKSSNYQSHINELIDHINKFEGVASRMEGFNHINMHPKYRKMLEKFVDKISRDITIPMDIFYELADGLKVMRNTVTTNYVRTILDPFNNRGFKAPSELPTPSATFSVRSSFSLNTNASGNLAFYFDPCFLTTANASTFYLNNDVTLVGNASSNFFKATEIGQILPALLYGKYRVVSAGLKLYSTSSANNSTGFATIGVQFDSATPNNIGTVDPSLARYGNFQLIENSYFKDSMALNNIGGSIQTAWLPLDPSFLKYNSVGTGGNNCSIIGYVNSATASSSTIRIEIVVNYEATPELAYADFMPIDFTYDVVNQQDLRNVQIGLQNMLQNDKMMSPDKFISEFLPETNTIKDLPIPGLFNGDFIKPIVTKSKELINDLIVDVKEEINKTIKTSKKNEDFDAIDTLTSMADEFGDIRKNLSKAAAMVLSSLPSTLTEGIASLGLKTLFG